MNLSRQTGARARRLLLTVIAVLAGAAGVAYATTQITTASPAQTSVVSACANKTNGDLRLVSGSGDCRTNEQLLSWNVVGPQGATGPQGPQGVQGVQGVQGPAGKDGQNVTSSLLGANDPNCLFGGASFTAFDRQTYACNGAPGRAGANGKNGANGTNGIDGVNGHDGANGNDGVSVTSTPLAANDPNCQYGGAAFTSASGTTYACNGAPGANGTNGTNGRDGTSGAGLTSFDGVNGLPCTRDGQAGSISTSYGSDGTITLKCTVTINVSNDVHNCGVVGNDVSGAFANATAVCVGGVPHLGACDAGFVDWNGDASDGCEFAIVPDSLEPDDTIATAALYPAGSPVETISPAGDVDIYAMGARGSCHTTSSEFITSTTCSSTAPTVHSAPGVLVTFLDANGHLVGGNCESTSGTNKSGDFDSTTCTGTTIDNMAYIKISAPGPAAYAIN